VNGDREEQGSVEGDSKGKGEGDQNQVSPVRSPSREGRYSRALQRGLAIVACFTAERPLLGIRELAGMLEMSPATTHRYVSALATQGYLEQDSASSKYRLSLGAIDLGMAALSATGLCMHALPHIEELARSSEFAVQIGVLDGSEVLLVAALGPTRRDQRDPGCDARAGSRLPAYRTSLGKVLLAYLPTERRRALISGMGTPPTLQTPPTPRTVSSEADLRTLCARVLEDGFASSDGELVPGACAIAAPVRDESGDVVAAVNLVTQHGTVELTELARWFGGQLLATAERISTRLGYPV
jgi:IclR family pca regulon transcriptional regulator